VRACGSRQPWRGGHGEPERRYRQRLFIPGFAQSTVAGVVRGIPTGLWASSTRCSSVRSPAPRTNSAARMSCSPCSSRGSVPAHGRRESAGAVGPGARGALPGRLSRSCGRSTATWLLCFRLGASQSPWAAAVSARPAGSRAAGVRGGRAGSARLSGRPRRNPTLPPAPRHFWLWVTDGPFLPTFQRPASFCRRATSSASAYKRPLTAHHHR
jgi:hypothetical protein